DVLECMTSDEVFNYPVTASSCILPVTEYQSQSLNLSVFPNPSTGSFVVDLDNADIKEVIITDLLGWIVYQQPIFSRTEIDIRYLPTGTYFLTALDKQNRRITKKIISCP